MAKKKLTEEQENEIKTLLENNKMLEKTKKEGAFATKDDMAL